LSSCAAVYLYAEHTSGGVQADRPAQLGLGKLSGRKGLSVSLFCRTFGAVQEKYRRQEASEGRDEQK